MTAIILGKQWLPLFSSLELLVGPVSDDAVSAARAAFQQAKGDFDFAEVDKTDPAAVEAAAELWKRADKAYVLAMAANVIFDWRGVGGADQGDETELPFSADLIPDLFENHIVFDWFNTEYLGPYYDALLEKNASSRSLNGSTRSAAKPIAPGA